MQQSHYSVLGASASAAGKREQRRWRSAAWTIPRFGLRGRLAREPLRLPHGCAPLPTRLLQGQRQAAKLA